MTARWLENGALSFDIESTGLDTANDRIVTATAIRLGNDGIKECREWLLSPGIDIPASATAIHGVSDEYAKRHGLDASKSVFEMAEVLVGTWQSGVPVLIMNSPYDLAMLQSELARYGWAQMDIGPVIDPLALDRTCEPKRMGKRNLTALAQRYAVKQEQAHSSKGDAVTAARVAWAIAKTNPDLDRMTLEELQMFQADGHRRWADDFGAYLARQGKRDDVNRAWPC